ncbi:uncharacterized protein LOC62_04G006247 [Vanrija pseudolonga]|uniref:Uncharacterized protein n=1 Tax=Vanrija pseudolonga TaxID=143232 RepID=A0AAF0YA73_9TREE|nr:hypothetical protein LOC62_04G006247 [Vanrija pseudolonga]
MLGLISALVPLAWLTTFVAAQTPEPDPLFIGCLSKEWWQKHPEAPNYPNKWGWVQEDSNAQCQVRRLVQVADIEQTQDYCSSSGYGNGFSYYSPQFFACSNWFLPGQVTDPDTGETINLMTNPVDAYGTCDENSVTVSWVNTFGANRRFWWFSVCLPEMLPNAKAFVSSTTGNIKADCYDYCRTMGTSMALRVEGFYPPNLGGPPSHLVTAFECACYDRPNDGPATPSNNCQWNSWLLYNDNLPLEPSPAANRRRRLKEQHQQNRRRFNGIGDRGQHHLALCPRPTLACAVPGTDGYECVDTSLELESCGGCVHGEYGVAANGTSFGQDKCIDVDTIQNGWELYLQVASTRQMFDYCYGGCAQCGRSVAYQITSFSASTSPSPGIMDTVLSCKCYYRAPGLPPVPASNNCKWNSWFYYNDNVPPIQPSQAANRRRLLLEQDQHRLQFSGLGDRGSHHLALCPRPTLACNVPGTDTFECINTSQELESCGGCLNGEFGLVANATRQGYE